MNFGGTITIQTLSLGAFTGTFDNSVNNNNITVTGSFTALSLSGSGTRTINLGSATYTLSANTVTFAFNLVTGLTLSAASATVSFTGTTGSRTFLANGGGALSFGTVSFAASSGAGYCLIGNTFTCGTLNVTAPNLIQFPAGGSMTISNSLAWTGNSSSQIAVTSSAFGTSATIAAAGGSTIHWCALRDMTFTGSPIANDSFNLLNNSGITINPPGGSGTTIVGGVGIIGS